MLEQLSFLSDQQSSDREIGLLCSQLFAYPNESHLLSPQGRSSNESVLLPRPQRGLGGVRMVDPGRAAGGGGLAPGPKDRLGTGNFWSAGVSQPRLCVQAVVGTCPRNRAGLCLPPTTTASSLKALL